MTCRGKGCNAPELDNHDIRVIDETLNGTTSTIGWHSKLRGIALPSKFKG